MSGGRGGGKMRGGRGGGEGGMIVDGSSITSSLLKLPFLLIFSWSLRWCKASSVDKRI